MSASPAAGPVAPPRGDRVTGVLRMLMVVLAVVGVVVTLWRPLAPELPQVATSLARFSSETLATIDAYRQPRLVGGVLGVLVGVLVPVLVVFAPWGRRVVRWVAGPFPAVLWRGAALGALIAAATSLVRLPLSFWIGYLHEGRWGLRTAPAGLWVRDWVLGEALAWAGAAVAGAGLAWLLRRWPRTWHWRAATAALALTGLLVAAHPLLIQPLFLPSRPLDDARVEALVEPLLAEVGMHGVPVRLGDASLRTTRVNALVAGVGPTRRVVLYDNLLELPDEQVRFVLAHELAHREHLDIPRGILGSAAGILAAVLVLRRLLASRRARRLVDARAPDDVRLVALAMAAAAVLQLVGSPVAMLASRRAEAAADARALELTDEPSALVRLARTFVVRDLASPEHEWWVRLLWGSHPSPADRIRVAAATVGDDAGLPSLEQLQTDERSVRHPAIGDRTP